MHVSIQLGDSEPSGSDVRRMGGRVKGRSGPRLARAQKNNPEAGATSRHLGAPPGIRRFPALLQGLGRREWGQAACPPLDGRPAVAKLGRTSEEPASTNATNSKKQPAPV